MKEQPLQLNYQKTSFRLLLFFGFLLVSTFISAQKISVLDERGNPVIGATVFSKDMSFASTTDENGQCTIPTDANYPIIIRFLGYDERSVSKEELSSTYFSVQLSISKTLIDEIILIGRTDIRKEDLAYEASTISRADIQLSNAQTTTDALNANSDVYVQKSQMGGGSPVIRGFEANKLLLVVDGVRMNNAIYRSGHLQNAITIDPAILENMEVIFGPGSLVYGSDALGGVIHFQSKSLNLNPNTMNTQEGNYALRYGSSNQEKTIHGDYTTYGKKWASLTSISFTDYDDLKIGKNRSAKYQEGYGQRKSYIIPSDGSTLDSIVQNENPNLLRHTGYSQFDILQKLRYQASENLSFSLNTQYSNSSNIPRYDALTETQNGVLRYAEWNYGPQQRFLSSLTTKFVPRETKIYDKIQWIIAYQNIEEVRITRNYLDPISNEQLEHLNIINTTLDISRTRGAHQWYTGIDGNYNILDSRAYQGQYVGGKFESAEGGLTRYPNGDNNTQSIGLYAQYYFIPAEKPYKINTGLRYDFNRVYTQFEPDNIFEWPDYFYQGVSNTNQSLNWSTGLHYDLPSNFKIRLLAGSSFRAPNVDDIAKIRLKSDEISIPNPMLTPEKSINGEATISYKSKTTEIGLTGFYTRLSDAIVRQNYTLPNGDSEYITNGDTFQIVANINAENAIIQGISFNAKHQISSTLLLRAGVSFTKGDIVSEGVSVEPLAHIPPTYGNVSLQYNRKRLLTNLGFRYNGNKALDRFGGSTDNPEFATPEGSLSWYTLHMNVRYKIYESLQLQLGVDNILDQFYVPFASGVPGAGRHVSLTLRGSF